MASIDGLITGMSTTDTINQLMLVEASSQNALKTKITTGNKVVSAYQSVNSRLSSMATAAKALGTTDTWGAMKASSNSDAAVVSARAGAAPGSLSFRVDKLAAAHAVTFTDKTKAVSSVSDAAGSPVMTGSTFDIKLADGSTKTLTPADQSLQSVVAAINGTSDSAYKASAVQIEPGKFTLQLTARQTGASTSFTAPVGLDKLGAGVATTIGSNAELTVGTDSTFTITSASNTFADVLPGVTVTATKVQKPTDAPVTIDLASDSDSVRAKVKALVDNANVALTEIAAQSKTKNGNVAAGVLVGDSAMRKISQDILSAVSGGAPGLGSNGATASFSEVGISVDRSGKLTMDEAKFTAAFAADPARTQKFFDSYGDATSPTGQGAAGKFEPGFDNANGLGRKLEAIALIGSEGVVDPSNPEKAKQGTLQGLIQRRTETITQLNDQVSKWDVRLESRRTALQRQFSSLEVALGKMQQQSSWLAGQLAGLSS
jgi:flagellar hook-associated protein 2